jgi:hypothetical protein
MSLPPSSIDATNPEAHIKAIIGAIHSLESADPAELLILPYNKT